MKKVTIIIPIYNLEKYIKKCIDSVIKQTLKEIEIILVDDGSTDASPSICDDYAKNDDRIKVVHQKNMGLSGARNTGIHESTGKWFMIVDGDDWLEPDAVEVLYKNAEDNDSDIFISSFYDNYPQKQIKDSFFNEDRLQFHTPEEKTYLQENCISRNKYSNKKCVTNVGVTWARLYKRQFIIDKNLEFIVGLKRTQDAIFNLYAFEYANKVDYIDIPTHHYRIWENSASRKYSKDFHITANELSQHILEFMKKTNKEIVMKQAYYSKVFKLLIEIIKIEIIPIANNLSFKEKKKFLKQLSESDIYSEAIKNVDKKTLNRNQNLVHTLLKYKLYYVVLLLFILKR